jgi:PPOX class probable F420-dependent enzyme
MKAAKDSKFDRVVQRRLKKEYFVWFTTVGANLSPQPRPVWFIWEKDSFLIFSQPNTHKVYHLKSHPNVTLHFNTPDEKGEKEVVVFVGTATIDTSTPPAHKIAAYIRKYKKGILELGSTPEQFGREYSVAIRVKVKEVRGWP